MLKFILLGSFVFILGCSQENSKVFDKEESIESLATFIDTSTTPEYFGEVTGPVTKIFTFKNNGDTAGNASPQISGQGFNIILHNCSNVSPGRACTVRVNFGPKGLSGGTYNATLTVQGDSKDLSVTYSPPATSASLEVRSSGTLVSEMDFGILSGNQSVVKIFKVQNVGNASSSALTTNLSSPDYSFLINSCQGKVLAPTATCEIRVQFSSTGKGIQTYNAALVIDSISVNLTAQVTSPTPSGSALVKFFEGTTEIASPFSLGSTQGGSLTKTLVIKNMGTSATGISSAILSDPMITFMLNSCVNKNLIPGGSCSVRVSFNSLGKANGVYQSDLSFGAFSVTLNASLAALPPASDIFTGQPSLVTPFNPTTGVGGTTWFGNIDPSNYNMASWSGVINMTNPTNVFWDFRKFPSPLACDSTCVSRIDSWLSPLTRINLGSNPGPIIDVVIASSMKKPNGNVVQVQGKSTNGSRLIADLYPTDALFHFNGGGSPHNLNNLGQHWHLGGNTDGVEYRRNLTPNEIINLKNTQGSNIIRDFNSSNQLRGEYTNIDYFIFGAAPGITPPVNFNPIFDTPRVVNLELKNYPRNNLSRMGLNIHNLTQINTAIEDSLFTSWLNNPSWYDGGKAPVIRYFNSSLRKTGIHPEINYVFKDAKTSCSSIASGSEVDVIRGNVGNQITDAHCGIRVFENQLEANETVFVTYESQTSNFPYAMNVGFHVNQSLYPNSKVYLYVPPTSQEIPNNRYGNTFFAGCGNRVVNHKSQEWFGAWDIIDCSTNQNIVAVGADPSDAPHRPFSQFTKLIIYDDATNKGNWEATCSFNTMHVEVQIRNTVTNNYLHFYSFGRNDPTNGGANLGFCGNKIKAIEPNYPALGGQIYLTCSLEDILNNTNNCISDNDGSLNSKFEIEFVDTSTSSQTLESFIRP